MKPECCFCSRKFVRACLLAWLVACLNALTVPGAFAHRTPSYRCAGIVQSVDDKAKAITLKPDAKGKSMRLVWNAQTQFTADGQASNVEALKPGTPIKARYVSFLFGAETATEVTWGSSIDAGAAETPSPGGNPPTHHWWQR